MSHEAENKKETAAASEAEKTVTPETEPKAEGKHEEKHESKHEHHHEKAALEAKLEASEKKNEELKNQLLNAGSDEIDGVSGATLTTNGVKMMLDKAAKALENLNITEIEALNKPFDPNFMNAVQQVPPAEGQESGDVVQVFQKGYKIGDKIIRHATVVVAE